MNLLDGHSTCRLRDEVTRFLRYPATTTRNLVVGGYLSLITQIAQI